MRNAVIRKKALKEQAIIRKYLLTPQRFIVPSFEADDTYDWTSPNFRHGRLGVWRMGANEPI